MDDETLKVLARLAVDPGLCRLVLIGEMDLARKILATKSGEIVPMSDEEIEKYRRFPCLNLSDVKAVRFEIE